MLNISTKTVSYLHIIRGLAGGLVGEGEALEHNLALHGVLGIGNDWRALVEDIMRENNRGA